MSVDLVERNYILWERLAQPRRARARLFAVEEPRVCAVHPVEFEQPAGHSHGDAGTPRADSAESAAGVSRR